MKNVGIVIHDRGAAVVHVEHGPDEALLVTAIERLPFNLTAVANRVGELDREMPEARFVIDSDGLGAALWQVLGPPEDLDRWHLYAAKGVERQRLVDTLLVAIHEERFHFAPGLAEQEAMTRALTSYHRQVKADGEIGSELVVALLLACIPPPPEKDWKPMVYWGKPPFSPDDAFEGASLADQVKTIINEDTRS